MEHLDHLYRVALHLAKEPHEAQDLVQETYARALTSYRQFTPGTHLKAWLTKILYNFFHYSIFHIVCICPSDKEFFTIHFQAYYS